MISAIDHIVLTAQDMDKTIYFYCEILGMTLQRFSPPDGSADRLAVLFGQQKINLHDASSPYIPHARCPVAGAVDICLLSDVTVENWCKRFEEFSVSIENGPVAKTGTMGPLWSIYVRDPDGNLIEISNQKT